jgi:hypothetical protein
MPILIHTGSIKWSKDGSVELGGTLPRASTPNLVFSENRLLLRADFQGRSGLAITQVFESVTLPEFTLTIGSKAVALRPASVTLQRNTLIGAIVVSPTSVATFSRRRRVFRSTSQK